MQPPVRDRLAAASLDASAGTPGDVDALMREGYARWKKLVGELGLRLD
jgi:hypothetical protein